MFRKTFLCLFLVPLFSGCGDGTGVPSNLPQTSVPRRAVDLELIASLPKRRYAIGEFITITLQVTNKHTSEKRLIFGSSSKSGYIITQGATQIAQSSGIGAAVITPITLQPSEQYAQSVTWEQRDSRGNAVPAGQYTIRAFMPVNSIDGADYTNGKAQAELFTQPLEITIEN